MRQLKSIFILLLALGQPLLAVAEQSSRGTATLTFTDETPQCVTDTFDTPNLEVSVPVGAVDGRASGVSIHGKC